jgi:thiol:disulfide interchange protein DsbD
VRSLRLALLALAMLACRSGSRQAPAADAGPPTPAARAPSHVDVELLASTSHVIPGQQFRVAARFKIDPGWHIYGTDPGDSGLPTRVTWTAPAGFDVGPTQYPPAARFESPGKIVTFGYERSVVLISTVRPPAQLATGVPLRARLSWLACKEECIPEKRDLALAMPVALPGSLARPLNRDVFVDSTKEGQR